MTSRKYARNFKPATERQTTIEQVQHEWRTEQECVIYARQSTTKQLVENRESSEMQTKDQLERVQVIGWRDKNITVFVEGNGKRGVSGTLRIDERPGLSALLEGVYNDKFKTIFVYNEGRLFRDEWQIQVNTFIKACYDHDVIIATWAHRYDFRRNSYDADMFRHQCEMAARFIKDHVKGVLHPARDRVAARGLYAGGRLSIGYILDRRKYVDGKFNPDYNRFMVDEPRAKVIRWIFKRYKELGGNLTELGRELNAKPRVFPPYEVSIEGPKPPLPVSRNGTHGLTRGGLVSILTNPVYIGYFKYHDQILRDKEGLPVINHTRIIDENLFWYSFNSLSPLTIDGEINEERTHKLVRYNQYGKQPSQALLKEIITSPGASVSTARTSATSESYTIVRSTSNFEYRYQARTDVARLDAEFVQRMFYYIHLWKDEQEEYENSIGEVIYNRLQEEKDSNQQMPTNSIDGQLAETRQKIARLDRVLKVASDALDDKTIIDYAKQLKGLRALEDTLEGVKENAEKEAEAEKECETLLDRALVEWNAFSLRQKRRTIRLAVESVSIARETPRWLRVEIAWKGPLFNNVDTGFFWLTNATSPDWQPDEKEIIYQMYPYESADAILEKLPHRTWQAIKSEADALQIKRHVRSAPKKHQYRHISIEDFNFMGKLGIEPCDNGHKQNMIWTGVEAIMFPEDDFDWEGTHLDDFDVEEGYLESLDLEDSDRDAPCLMQNANGDNNS